MNRRARDPDPFVPEAVIFDMDGLLLDTEGPAREAMRRSCKELALALPDALSLSMIGAPVDTCRRLLVDHFGADVPADAIFAGTTRHLTAAIDAGRVQVKPGVGRLLDWLDMKGLPRAVATSSMRAKALHHLRAARIAGRFDAIVTRDDVANGKPHPDLFLLAAQRLRQPPAHCLAFEDSHNGVRAAHRAGMPVIMVPDLLPATPEMHGLAVAVVDTLAAALPLLQRGRPTAETCLHAG